MYANHIYIKHSPKDFKFRAILGSFCGRVAFLERRRRNQGNQELGKNRELSFKEFWYTLFTFKDEQIDLLNAFNTKKIEMSYL